MSVTTTQGSQPSAKIIPFPTKASNRITMLPRKATDAIDWRGWYHAQAVQDSSKEGSEDA